MQMVFFGEGAGGLGTEDSIEIAASLLFGYEIFEYPVGCVMAVRGDSTIL